MRTCWSTTPEVLGCTAPSDSNERTSFIEGCFVRDSDGVRFKGGAERWDGFTECADSLYLDFPDCTDPARCPVSASVCAPECSVARAMQYDSSTGCRLTSTDAIVGCDAPTLTTADGVCGVRIADRTVWVASGSLITSRAGFQPCDDELNELVMSGASCE